MLKEQRPPCPTPRLISLRVACVCVVAGAGLGGCVGGMGLAWFVCLSFGYTGRFFLFFYADVEDFARARITRFVMFIIFAVASLAGKTPTLAGQELNVIFSPGDCDTNAECYPYFRIPALKRVRALSPTRPCY